MTFSQFLKKGKEKYYKFINTKEASQAAVIIFNLAASALAIYFLASLLWGAVSFLLGVTILAAVVVNVVKPGSVSTPLAEAFSSIAGAFSEIASDIYNFFANKFAAKPQSGNVVSSSSLSGLGVSNEDRDVATSFTSKFLRFCNPNQVNNSRGGPIVDNSDENSTGGPTQRQKTGLRNNNT